MKEKNLDLLIAVLLFLLLFVLKFNVLNDSYFWDDDVIYFQSWVYSQNNFSPDLGPYYITGMGIDSGHTPLPYWLVAIGFSLGKPLLISHLFWLLFSFIGIFFTYKLGSFLFNRKVGVAAALLLLFCPIYFAQTGILNPDILVTSLGVLTLYLFLKNKKAGYIISGGLLVIAKENGFLAILAILGYILVRDFKKNKVELLKNLSFAFIPILVFFGWLFYHWTFSGSFYISQDRALNSGIELLLKFISRTYQVFFRNYNWVVSLFIFLSFFSVSDSIKNITKRQVVLFFSLLIVSLVAFLYLNSIISFVSPFIGTRSIDDLLEKSGMYGIYVVLVFALAVTAIIFRKYLNFRTWKDPRVIPFILMFVLYFAVFTSLKYSTPRYLLPVYPFLYILSARSISKITKKYMVVFLLLVLALFAFSWFGTRSGEPGYRLEDNMEYRDAIIVQKQMDQYIEQNYPESIILTQWPMVTQLRFPMNGFVSKPLRVMDVDHYLDSNEGAFTFNMPDAYLYIYVEKKNVTVNDVRLYDPVYTTPLKRTDFDIFYYSPESQHQGYYRIVKDFNLTLIKRFEHNGKVAELYA